MHVFFMTFFYFAYGSNMLTERLRARCGSAEAIGRAIVTGYELVFSKRSVDGSGKGTLIERAGANAHGVLFRIALGERGKLDDFEGRDYRRVDDFRVTDANGNAVLSTAYLARQLADNLVPYDWYLALVLQGARQHNLPDNYITLLRAFAHATDGQANRQSRQDALAALRTAGIQDYTKVL